MKALNRTILILCMSVMLNPLTIFAAPILGVDFNSGSSPTETGFSPFNVVGTPSGQSVSFSTDPVLTSGTTTIMLSSSAGNLDSRDRGTPSDNGPFTFGELYRDFATTFNNDRALLITASGLIPNYTYSFTFYAWDVSGLYNFNIFTNTTPGNPPASVTILQGPSPTYNYEYAMTLNAISDASGVVTFSETTAPGTSPRLNGFQISAVADQGSTFLLLTLSLLCVVICRQRLQLNRG